MNEVNGGRKIYANEREARAACEEYLKAVDELQFRLGVWEEGDDSCAGLYVHAEYWDETGQVRRYCHG